MIWDILLTHPVYVEEKLSITISDKTNCQILNYIGHSHPFLIYVHFQKQQYYIREDERRCNIMVWPHDFVRHCRQNNLYRIQKKFRMFVKFSSLNFFLFVDQVI